ncbi:MAG: hypothetical protein ACOCR1_01090 [Planctomycetota bacterium]
MRRGTFHEEYPEAVRIDRPGDGVDYIQEIWLADGAVWGISDFEACRMFNNLSEIRSYNRNIEIVGASNEQAVAAKRALEYLEALWGLWHRRSAPLCEAEYLISLVARDRSNPDRLDTEEFVDIVEDHAEKIEEFDGNKGVRYEFVDGSAIQVDENGWDIDVRAPKSQV